MVARQAGVDSALMRRGNIPEDQKSRVYQALPELKQWPIFFDCQAGLSALEIVTRARKLVATKGLDFLIVDYLGLLRRKSDNIVEELGEMTKLLRVIGKNLKIPVLVLHQLSRAVERRAINIPILSDLRDSGHIEQNADQVWFLYTEGDAGDDWEKQYKSESGPRILFVAKNRMGRTGKAKLYFEATGPYFRDFEGVDSW